MSLKSGVSCVIFLYNEEKFIEDAIQSVLNQSAPVDEIIVCDDFSDDETPIIVKRLAKKHSKIKYVLSDEKGKFHAYKTGLKHVSLSNFFIMAGDDAIETNYVANALKYLKNNNLKLGYSSYKVCDSELNEKSLYEYSNKGYNTEKLLFRNWVGGFLFGQSILIDKILLLNDDRIEFEDWVGSIMFSKIYGKVFLIPGHKYLYRRHDQATTVVFNRKKLRKRDLKLYDFLLSSDDVSFEKSERQIILDRIMLNRILIGEVSVYSYFMKLMFSKSVTINERTKLLLLLFGMSESLVMSTLIRSK